MSSKEGKKKSFIFKAHFSYSICVNSSVLCLQVLALSESKGRVKYEVQLNDKLENFILEFHCPSRLFSRNYLHVISCSSGISVDVRDLNEGGSPLRGTYPSAVFLPIG
jgi:hypothetical protein